MKPLVFLTLRSFVNGVRRAFTSPQRLIGLLFIVIYYAQFLIRPFFLSHGTTHTPRPAGVLDFRMDWMEAGVFTVFAGLSFILFIGSLSPRGGFRPADVDVLFATPVNPKLVLFFRMIRDSLASLFIPIFVALVASGSSGPNVFAFFRNYPAQGAVVFRFATISYVLLAISWVCVGYAVSLFVNRADEQSDRNKKWIDGTIVAVVLGTAVYIGIRFRIDPSIDTFLELTHNPFIHVLFLSATAASAIVLSPLHRNIWEGVGGWSFLIAVIFASYKLAMTQIEWLYDQAAARGLKTAEAVKLQRSGDISAIVASRAKDGRVKVRRLSQKVSQWSVRGSKALLWKELVLISRGTASPILMVFMMMLGLVGIVLYATNGPLGRQQSTTLFLIAGFSVLMVSQISATTFADFLKKGDLQKPLPFSPGVTVFWEVISKSFLSLIFGFLVCAMAVSFDVQLFSTGISIFLMAPTLAIVINAVGLLVILLFPDVDDATQRGFRSVMLMLGGALAAAPGILSTIGILVIHLNPLVAVIPFDLLNLGIALGLSFISGGLYGSFNPSD